MTDYYCFECNVKLKKDSNGYYCDNPYCAIRGVDQYPTQRKKDVTLMSFITEEHTEKEKGETKT